MINLIVKPFFNKRKVLLTIDSLSLLKMFIYDIVDSSLTYLIVEYVPKKFDDALIRRMAEEDES